MKRMSAAKAIAQVLVHEGVEKVFCVPGESFLSLLDELYDESTIEVISGRQEGGVSFMAEGYAKASGKVGVCMATRGPGATNLSIGLHTAYHDSTPVVAFIGQVESVFRGKEAFQEIDMAEYFSHIVKWSVELSDPTRAPEIVRRAFHIAQSGRPGPVLISLPEDILDQVAEMDLQKSIVNIYSHPRPEREAVIKAKEILLEADRPIIIAGGGVTSTKSGPELVKLAEKLNIPVVTALRRLDAFPNDHSHYVGTLWSGTPKYLINAIGSADVILAIGTRLSQGTTQNYSIIKSQTKLIHVDISAEELNKSFRPDLGIIADSMQFILDLLQEIEQAEIKNDRMNYVLSLRAEHEHNATPQRKYDDSYVDLEGMMFDLIEGLSADTIITSDAGNYFGWILRYYPFREGGTCIGPVSGAMGYGLPAAIGAKLAHPDKKVISISGDGGFMMTLQEMETAVRYKMPIISIIANNNMYGTIRAHQERRFPGRVMATELSNPNFAEVMKLMGGHGELVKKNEDFLPALYRALNANKPSVIEVICNPQQISVDKTINDLRGSFQI